MPVNGWLSYPRYRNPDGVGFSAKPIVALPGGTAGGEVARLLGCRWIL